MKLLCNTRRLVWLLLPLSALFIAGACVKRMVVQPEVEYALHDAIEMHTLQQEIDDGLNRNSFRLRTDPVEVPGGWTKLFSFVHASDIQLRDYGITLIGTNFARIADYVAGGAQRDAELDQNDEVPFIALVGALNTSTDRPRFFLHTGDAIDAGTKGEALAFVSIANRLEVPWFNAIGNHDVLFFGTFTNRDIRIVNPRGAVEPTFTRPTFLLLHGENYFQYVERDKWVPHPPTETFTLNGETYDPASFRHGFDHQDYQTLLNRFATPGNGWYSIKTNENPGIRLLVLDTTIPDDRVWNIGHLDAPLGAEGWITREQFEWLKRELTAAEAAREYVIIAGHHPLANEKGHAQLKGAFVGERSNKLVDYLKTKRHVLAYFGGHTHRAYINNHAVGDAAFWEVIAPSVHEFPQLALKITM